MKKARVIDLDERIMTDKRDRVLKNIFRLLKAFDKGLTDHHMEQLKKKKTNE